MADPRVSLSAKGALRRVHPAARAGVATPAAWTGGPGRFLLDSLPAMTVIVDERGDVAAANEAWRRFGRENGAGPAVAEGVGQNYFAICGDAVMAGCPPDARAVAGIKRVLRGELPVFTLDYVGQGSAAERWFMLTVTPLDGGGAVIAHTDITARRRTEMSAAALIETGRELAGGLDPAEVARQIASTVVRVFGTQHAALYRLDREVARLVCIAAAGLGEPEDWRGQTVGVGEGIVGRAAAEERSVWTPDVLNDSRIDLAARAVERVTADGFRSVLAVPLKAGERVIGVLNLGDAAGRTYTEDELALLAAFVGQGAVALENSALYREIRDARDFLQSITENSPDAIITTDGRGRLTYFYSEPGRGTAFKIYLPRVAQVAAEVDDTTSPRAAVARGDETVLLVEDEPEVRDLAREILEVSGYTVLQTCDPLEAVVMAERHPGPIHLLLTDVIMPRQSGRALVERLRPLRPEMQVLYMSGYTNEAIVRHGVLDPDTLFIQKPFTPDALGHRVRAALDRPRAL